MITIHRLCTLIQNNVQFQKHAADHHITNEIEIRSNKHDQKRSNTAEDSYYFTDLSNYRHRISAQNPERVKLQLILLIIVHIYKYKTVCVYIYTTTRSNELGNQAEKVQREKIPSNHLLEGGERERERSGLGSYSLLIHIHNLRKG